MSGAPDQLRIFRCYQRLPPEPGGMEQHIALLTAEQRRQGVEVINIFNRGLAEGPAVRVLAGYDLRRVKPAAIRDAVFYHAARFAVSPPSDDKINILHVHGDYSAFLAAHLLVPVIKPTLIAASIHGDLRQSRSVYRFSAAYCDVIFATGSKEAQQFSRWVTCPVHHLPSAPLDHFFEMQSPGAPTCDVIAAGNFLPIKRTELLVECAARTPQWRYSIYGDGPDRSRIEAAITRLGCRNITLHGRIPRDAVAAAMHAARVYVNVSEKEGTPTAALEAMACGLPIVLTPSNDYHWLIENGRNGYLTKGWTVEEIVGHLSECLADEDRRRAMGQANRKIAEGHRWSAKARFVTDCMLEGLEKTCKEARA